jgi:hypothetical protein
MLLASTLIVQTVQRGQVWHASAAFPSLDLEDWCVSQHQLPDVNTQDRATHVVQTADWRAVNLGFRVQSSWRSTVIGQMVNFVLSLSNLYMHYAFSGRGIPH